MLSKIQQNPVYIEEEVMEEEAVEVEEAEAEEVMVMEHQILLSIL
jgi:bifunctional DNase/RNase